LRGSKVVAASLLFLSPVFKMRVYSASLGLGLASNMRTFNVVDTVRFGCYDDSVRKQCFNSIDGW